jgi:uncharacterized protein
MSLYFPGFLYVVFWTTKVICCFGGFLQPISSLKYTDPMPTIAAAPRKLETLQALARTVAQASGAVQVILFGSVARGDARDDSDLDLLLLFPDAALGPSLFEMTEPVDRAMRALWPLEFAVDFYPMRLSDFVNRTSVLADVVAREGITLFEVSRG